MTSEISPGQQPRPAERVEITPKEQALKKVEEQLNQSAMESPQFQAFADYIDYMRAETDLEIDDSNNPYTSQQKDMKYCLIEETIRQRRNGVLGYEQAYDNASLLIQNVRSAALMEKQP